MESLLYDAPLIYFSIMGLWKLLEYSLLVLVVSGAAYGAYLLFEKRKEGVTLGAY